MKLTELREKVHEKTRGPRGKVGARKLARRRKAERKARRRS